MKKLLILLLFGSQLFAFQVSAQSKSASDIPFRLAMGQMLFDNYCSECHGADLRGSESGPPLLHPYYIPSHYSDSAFYSAVLQGVKAQQWNFGDMKPVMGISEAQIKRIIAFVRYVQKQNGMY